MRRFGDRLVDLVCLALAIGIIVIVTGLGFTRPYKASIFDFNDLYVKTYPVGSLTQIPMECDIRKCSWFIDAHGNDAVVKIRL